MSDHEKRIQVPHKKSTAKLCLQKRPKDEIKMQVKEVLERGAVNENLNETLEFRKCVKKDTIIKGVGRELRDKFSYSKRFAHSSDRISKENTGNEPLVPDDRWSGKDEGDQIILCQICHKDLSHMNSQRKSQHVNKCVDKVEHEKKVEEQKLRLLEKAKTAVLDCPFCGKPFKSLNSRSSHLKKCAAKAGVSTDKMISHVKKQEEERQMAVAAGIIPNMARSLRQKQSSPSESSVSRKKRFKEPRSQFDEDVQMAMAISSSLAEEKHLLDLDKVSVTGSTSSSSTGDAKKLRKKKQEDGEPLLLALSEEEKKKRLSNRVANLILSQTSLEKDKFDCTPILKKSNLGQKKNKVESQCGSDDQESKELPGLWTRSILSEKDTANKAVFYVRSLMPPIEISKAPAGSRFKLLTKSPDKCSSLDQNKGHPHAVTSVDCDTTSEMIIASTQTAIILAELAGDEDGERKEKDEEESKMPQDLQHNFESSKRFHDHVMKNDGTQKSDGLQHASGFCPEALVAPKEDEALVLQQHLCTDLRRLVNNPCCSDLIIVTKDKQKLHAHRLLLMARCPALLQMCADGTVLLEESNEETVLALLTYLYSGHLNLPPHVFPQLVTLANRLDLHELLMVCNQLVISQHAKSTEREGNESNEQTSQVLKDIWGESNSYSENPHGNNNLDDEDNDKENDFISVEDYQDIMCTQRRKIGYRTIHERDASEMNDYFHTRSEKKEWKDDTSHPDETNGSRNLIQKDKIENRHDSNKSGTYTERHSHYSGMEVYSEEDQTVISMNDRSRPYCLEDKDDFVQGLYDIINYNNMSIALGHEDPNNRHCTAVIRNDLGGDMEKNVTEDNNDKDKEMKCQSFPQQEEFGLEEEEFSLLSTSPINFAMDSSDIIMIEENYAKGNSSNISVNTSSSPRRLVTVAKCTYRDKLSLSDGQLNYNDNYKNNVYIEHQNEECDSILDDKAPVGTSLENIVKTSVVEDIEKGKEYIIDYEASSMSSSPVVSSNSFDKSADNNTSIQTSEKEVDISSDLFSSPTPIKDEKDKYKYKSFPFRDSCCDERKISTPIIDVDVRKAKRNQNGIEVSPFIDSVSKKRKLEAYSADCADKTPKRATPDRYSCRMILSKKILYSAEEKDAEQNNQDVEIVGDNFSEMCGQSPTVSSDRWKNKLISKDQISDVSTDSNYFNAKVKDDPDAGKAIKSFELDEAVRVMDDSSFKKENEMMKWAVLSSDCQIVDITDGLSLPAHTEKPAIETNDSQNNSWSLHPVLDENISIQADPNVWDDFDDCGVGFGDGLMFTPVKSTSLKNDSRCSQTQSTRKSCINDGKELGVVQLGKIQLTDDNKENDLSARGHSTISTPEEDNLEDSLMNMEKEEAALNDDSFIWMVANMPVDESNCEMKEEKSFSDTHNGKAVNFKTPEARSRKKKERKDWVPPSPFTPMPNYGDMSTPMLKKEIDKYGVKPLSKKKMLLVLQDIYHKTHQYETDSEVDVDDTDISNSQEEKCPSSSQESDISEVIEESFMEEKYTENDVPSSPQKCGENLTQVMMKFILDRPEIHTRMLMYEPLELDWLKKQMFDAGIKCSLDQLMNFLDEKCITFTMKSQRKDSRRGRGKKRRAKTSKESS